MNKFESFETQKLILSTFWEQKIVNFIAYQLLLLKIINLPQRVISSMSLIHKVWNGIK